MEYSRIISKNNKIEHWLNGVKILEYKRGSEDFRKKVAKSKFAKYADFGEAKKGHVLLQDHGSIMCFRNLFIHKFIMNRTKKSNFRWAVVALLFFATTVNYFDRFLLGILAPVLETEIGWTEQEYGYIIAAFQFAYATGTLLMGYVIDKLGTRWGFTIAVSLWSVASMLHAAVCSWVGFALARIGLGLSEAGNFPAAIKTVAEWFPKKERAFATGLFNGGSNAGAILAPILIPLIIAQFGSWKWVFILSGFLGFFWLIFWLILYRKPKQSRFTNQAEIDYINDGELELEMDKISWCSLLRYRQI